MDKYDESEEAQGMEIDASGSAQALQSKQEEIRRKLAAGGLTCVESTCLPGVRAHQLYVGICEHGHLKHADAILAGWIDFHMGFRGRIIVKIRSNP